MAVRDHDTGWGYPHPVSAPRRLHPLTRRAFTGTAVATTATALVGCEVLDGSGSPPPGKAQTTPTLAAPDADSELATRVGGAVADTGALAAAIAGAIPALAGDAGRLARLHAAHATLLGHPDAATPPTIPRDGARARRRLATAEKQLQADLVAGALEASGGALAQTLASMAAAVAQQRTVLG